jgi:glycosyltransferase involved in cell wall biosynthesis
MRIGVVTAHYGITGVPLAQARLARALARNGHDVDLIIGHVPPGLEVPAEPGVEVVALDRPKARQMLLPVIRYLRTARPDAVFSAEDHLNAVVLLAAILARSKAKISGSSRVTPFDTYSASRSWKGWLLKQAMRALMRRADALTCVSRDMVDQYRRIFKSPPHQCVYNIVDDPASRSRIGEPLDDPWFAAKEHPVIVAAGTLAPWKGFADLIRAVGELSRRGRIVRLVILGEGPDRGELEALVAQLGLTGLVRLPGHTGNPLRFFARADAFVLSSLVEGLPNVLVEAMMCGCTPVATDCPTGPREVLAGGRFGYLVPVGDPAALASGIERALAHPIPAERLAEAVRPFEEGRVLQRHFETLGLAEVSVSIDAPFAKALRRPS